MMRFIQKKTIQRLFIAFIILMFSTPVIAADFVSVNKDGVNIRSGPSTDKEILWEVFKDFPLQVVNRQNDWLQTKDFEGDQGWIYKKLVSNSKRVIVKVNTANMRIGPGKDYELVATVKYGVVFTPVEKDGDWIKVKHQDKTTGWIFRKLLWPSNPL